MVDAHAAELLVVQAQARCAFPFLDVAIRITIEVFVQHYSMYCTSSFSRNIPNHTIRRLLFYFSERKGFDMPLGAALSDELSRRCRHTARSCARCAAVGAWA